MFRFGYVGESGAFPQYVPLPCQRPVRFRTEPPVVLEIIASPVLPLVDLFGVNKACSTIAQQFTRASPSKTNMLTDVSAPGSVRIGVVPRFGNNTAGHYARGEFGPSEKRYCVGIRLAHYVPTSSYQSAVYPSGATVTIRSI